MKNIYSLFICFLLCSIEGQAQLYPDRHNTNWFDAWMSCTPSTSPNPERGTTHWILYDFGYEYPLRELQMWNANIPDSTNMGIQDFIIDYSSDGINWIEFGTFTLEEASSSSTYEGEIITDFNDISSRYLLINASSNYGGSCFSFSEIKIGIGTSTLPVDLLSFELECLGENVLATWKTGTEINNDHFNLEGSLDGITWEVVGQIPAKANPSHENQYSFEDTNALEGLVYYRLNQIDRDGSKHFSSAKSIRCRDAHRDFELYPNPASDFIDLSYDSETVQIEKLSVLDVLGQKIDLEVATENNLIRIPLKNLAVGTYFLQLRTRNNSFITKEFVKIE